MRRGIVVTVGAVSLGLLAPTPASGGQLADAFCALPEAQRTRVFNGSHPTRSGQVLIVPANNTYIGPGQSHDGPWNYLQRVPVFAYGPGFVEARGRVGRRVTLASLAPTQAELLGVDFEGDEGPLHEALLPEAERPEPPRLIVTLVWDAAGKNVLDAWRSRWPRLRKLIPKGTYYENAEVGSSPSVTPPAHATMGTGVFARTHGLTDLEVRDGGAVRGGWSKGPKLLLADSLADVYDADMGNEPKVGAVVGVPGHLGMIGHGSYHDGGDKDVAIVAKASGSLWGIRGQSKRFYRFPKWVNALPGLAHQARLLDQRDGRRDGRWRGNSLAGLRNGFDSPARIPYQTKIVKTLIKREGFGKDDVPDLLAINHKIIDHVGHEWHMHAPEMGDAIRYQDRDLTRLIGILNRLVGKGRWAMIMTADHGHTPLPSVSGMNPLDVSKIRAALTARFDDGDGVPVVKGVRPSEVFLNEAELKRNGYGLKAVARYLLALPKARVSASGGGSGKAFAAAIPTRMLPGLPCT